MKIRTIALIIAAATVVGLTAKTVKTTQKNLTPTKEAASLSTVKPETLVIDSVSPDSVVVRGFDKPLYSVKESFLVTNKYSRRITSVKLAIDYIDIADRTFHSRTVSVDCQIPAGATRQLSIKSFDLQKSYYYIRSRRPRAQSTPFQVAITVVSVTFDRK